MKLFLIKLIDWFDDTILSHRWYCLCNWIAHSKWWGEEVTIELTNEEFIILASMAHEQDITFNQLCVNILKESMKNNP